MDREITTALDSTPMAGADLIDFAEVKRRPRKPRPEPTPDELLEEFARAVRRTLLADLATWPEAFERRLREEIESKPHRSDLFGFNRSEWLWTRFRNARRLGDTEEPSRSGCGCGCRGFNGEVAEKLRKLRTAAIERREDPPPRRTERRPRGRVSEDRETASTSATPRVNGPRHIERAKRELLETLWYYGVRHIDRGRLRQHLVESVRIASETNANEPGGDVLARRVREMTATVRQRLRAGVYERGARRGQPYSVATRLRVEQELHGLQSWAKKIRARQAEFRAQLVDEAALVRRWTGCERAPRAAAGVA